MTSILIIEQNGDIKETKVKVFDEDSLYKKAGFKTDTGFKSHVIWKITDTMKVKVYGRTSGRANSENKYDFPPPIDNTLFFGKCLVVKIENDEPVGLKSSEWNKIYEKLHGGFEDIGNEDSDAESVDEIDPNVERTKSGYVKDEFVVDDDEIDDVDDDTEEKSFNEDDDDDNSSIDISVVTTKKRKQPARQVKSKTPAKYADDYISIDELSEEEYL